MPVPPAPFTAVERALLRHEFMVRFGQAPCLSDGIWLGRWRGGPQAGRPKMPAAVASMLERGLVALGPDRIGLRARFTTAGIAALRLLAQDRRALDLRHTPTCSRSSGRTRPAPARPGPGSRRGQTRGRCRPVPDSAPANPVKAPAARPTKAATLPRRATGQEDPVRRPALHQGAVRRGLGITKEAPSPAAPAAMGLHTANGARKYLTAGERDTFLRQAELADRQVRTLRMTLAYAGCRLSKALALTADRVDLAADVLTTESLKKHRAGIYRAVPVPPVLLDALDMVHGIRELQTRPGKGRGQRLWPWSRMIGWRPVHGVMRLARLDGPHASPKGLRHGFGGTAVTVGISLDLVQKWLGHAQLTTTAIYANAVGAEEKDIAQRMWT